MLPEETQQTKHGPVLYSSLHTESVLSDLNLNNIGPEIGVHIPLQNLMDLKQEQYWICDGIPDETAWSGPDRLSEGLLLGPK